MILLSILGSRLRTIELVGLEGLSALIVVVLA